MMLLVPLSLTACAGWPTWSHLAQDTGDLYAAGEHPPASVAWTDGGQLADDPTAPAMPLGLGEGSWFQLALSGAGTTEALVDTGANSGGGAAGLDSGDCGVASEFPPEERGAYLGEVGWLPMIFDAPGTLCLLGEWTSGHTVDLLLYDLSACAVPRGPVTDPTSGVVLGFDAMDGAAWSAGVVDGPVYGVAVAVAAPEGTDTVQLTLGVALAFPGESGGDSGACPDLPEAAP